ncbi:MAG TPA: LuxR C-terminal-related transcriptional regulator, partial [Solirubrobacteraceae bacterium]|nr:LuxR C-terminal-related transcriptional regulator [Solirubrobacteraceae bacterium]
GALGLARTAGLGDLVIPLVARAHVARAEGDPQGARRLLQEALALGRAGAASPGPGLRGLAALSAEQGDAPGARRRFEEALELARREGDQRGVAGALGGLGQLAYGEGDHDTAAALLREALTLQCLVGDAPGVADGLESMARLAADADHQIHAARLFGAAAALRERGGYVRPGGLAAGVETSMRSVRKALGKADLDAILARGAELSVEDAVAQAAKGPGRGERATSGWSSLTDREWEVALLVGDGLTNRQIAEKLFVSPWTVKTHLANIFTKLEMTRRSELAGEVTRRDRRPAAERA